MTDTSEEIKSLLIGLAVIAVIFQYNHPKTEYEVNWIVVAETECIKNSKSNCFKKLEKIKITYARNSKQMGTSLLMLERHYSKLTATMAAEKLA